MQIRCPVCDYSREVNLEKIPSTAEFATCPKCRHRFRFRAVDLDAVEHDATPPEPDPKHADVWDAVDSLHDRWAERDKETDEGYGYEDDEDRPGNEPGYGRPTPENAAIPWENPRLLGYAQSFLRTALWAFLQPSGFFASLSRRPALLPALLFFLIFGTVQYIFNVVWTQVMANMMHDVLIERLGEEAFAVLFANILENSLLSPAVISVPFQLAIQLFLIAGVFHLFIRIASPRTADFALAFKVAAYASVGFGLSVIPGAGALIAPVWFLVLLFIGCRNAFAIPWNKAVLAMTPLFLLLLLGASAQYSLFLGG